MTDTQTIVAAIAGAAGTIAGAIAGVRSMRRQRSAIARGTKGGDHMTMALVEGARSNAILAAKIDGLDRQTTINNSRLEATLAEIQTISARLQRTAETLERYERDERLDESQRIRLAKVRAKIARGLSSRTEPSEQLEQPKKPDRGGRREGE